MHTRCENTFNARDTNYSDTSNILFKIKLRILINGFNKNHWWRFHSWREHDDRVLKKTSRVKLDGRIRAGRYARLSDAVAKINTLWTCWGRWRKTFLNEERCWMRPKPIPIVVQMKRRRYILSKAQRFWRVHRVIQAETVYTQTISFFNYGVRMHVSTKSIVNSLAL